MLNCFAIAASRSLNQLLNQHKMKNILIPCFIIWHIDCLYMCTHFCKITSCTQKSEKYLLENNQAWQSVKVIQFVKVCVCLSKVMCLPIKAGIHMYTAYTNCQTLLYTCYEIFLFSLSIFGSYRFFQWFFLTKQASLTGH